MPFHHIFSLKDAALIAAALLLSLWSGCNNPPSVTTPSEHTIGQQQTLPKADEKLSYLVIGYNDLGMHCMNQDFSEFMILPPYNTLHAQVMEIHDTRTVLLESGITVNYSVPGNTRSVQKTNFWDFCPSLLGVTLPPNIGLAGNGLKGRMTFTTGADWVAAGIPLTPITDKGKTNPFQLANIVVTGKNGKELTQTSTVVPVSWELRCDLCHHGAPDAPQSNLEAHDLLHGTDLYHPENQKPVLCGQCHAQPELGLPGTPGTENLSFAMHNAHSPRMMDVIDIVPGGVICYACHPGLQTQCLRDLHVAKGMTCMDCHAGGNQDGEMAMLAVADPGRQPWTSMPRCDNCHHKGDHQYEQVGMLFKNSKGHGGLYCEACHNSTHAVVPTTDPADNVQSVLLQGHPGTIKDCKVCHRTKPKKPFRHQWIAAAGT